MWVPQTIVMCVDELSSISQFSSQPNLISYCPDVNAQMNCGPSLSSLLHYSCCPGVCTLAICFRNYILRLLSEKDYKSTSMLNFCLNCNSTICKTLVRSMDRILVSSIERLFMFANQCVRIDRWANVSECLLVDIK